MDLNASVKHDLKLSSQNILLIDVSVWFNRKAFGSIDYITVRRLLLNSLAYGKQGREILLENKKGREP